MWTEISQFFKITAELVPAGQAGAGDDKLVARGGLEPPEGGHLCHGVSPYEQDQRHLTI